MFPDDDIRKVMGLADSVDVSIAALTAVNIITRMNLAATYDGATTRLITIWLGAHIQEQVGGQQTTGLKRRKIGEAEDEYAITANTGLGLDLTKYGQNVQNLDTEGILAGLGKRRPMIVAMGPVPTSENWT